MALDRRALNSGGLGLLAAGASAAPRTARAQADYPSRPVTVLVPWPPGGPTDAFARLLTARLSADLGRPFPIDNRGGASGTIGMAAAARARADGYTVVVIPSGTYAIAPHLYQLPYETDRAFVGVGLLASMPHFMVVPRDSPARDLAGYLDLIKRPGNREVYANPGNGSGSHLATEMFLQMAGVALTDVGYRGGGPAVQAMLANEAGMLFLPSTSVMQLIRSGDLRALAVTSRQRSPLAPDVPTFIESGFPAYEVMEDFAMVAPAGTPAPILARLNAACVAALGTPETRERLDALAISPNVQPVEAWSAYLAAESGKWGEVIRSRNIRIQ